MIESLPAVATNAMCGMSSMASLPSALPSAMPFASRRAAIRCASAMPSPMKKMTFFALRQLLYDIPAIRVEYVRHEEPVLNTGFWRGVGVTHNNFVIESFVPQPFDYGVPAELFMAKRKGGPRQLR